MYAHTYKHENTHTYLTNTVTKMIERFLRSGLMVNYYASPIGANSEDGPSRHPELTRDFQSHLSKNQ